MSGSSFGKIFQVTTFGESHGAALGVVVDGMPAGICIDRELLKKLDIALPITLDCAESGVIEKKTCIEQNEIEDAPFTVFERYVGGDHLYEDLADAMSDKNATYAVAGILDPSDPAVISALITFDAFRRNEVPNIVISRFFIGDKTSICVYKIASKK